MSLLEPDPVVDTRDPSSRCIAFAGDRRLALGTRLEVALATRAHLEAEPESRVLVFDAETSRPVELDLRGTAEAVAARYAEPQRPGDGEPASADSESAPETSPRRGPGRPKLGVVGREVTLLPRHWEWLERQPGSASVTLRKLVEKARREGETAERSRRARDSAYQFMVVMAGDRPGFEEATRALFAGDATKLARETEAWPADVRTHTRGLASRAFGALEPGADGDSGARGTRT